MIDVLRGNGFKIEKNFQRPTWSVNIVCPLPNHKGAKERTPSFGYNFVTDHFSCFGCGQAGRAVEFLSIYTCAARYIVAEQILARYGGDLPDDCDTGYEDEISPLLFEASDCIREATHKHKDNKKALKQINRLVWWLDLYLMNRVSGKKVSSENLRRRIDLIKELI